MHSKMKVKKHFPNVTDELIERMYGFNVTNIPKLISDFRHTKPAYFEFLRRKYELSYKAENAINMADFYAQTPPVYYIFHCHIKSLDCVTRWHVKQTSVGTCLTLSPYDIYVKNVQNHLNEMESGLDLQNDYEHSFFADTISNLMTESEKLPTVHNIKELDFVVGFNESDSTFGWNGFDNGIMLYYSDADEDFLSQD